MPSGETDARFDPGRLESLVRVPPSSGLVERLRGRVQIPSRSGITLRLSDWRKLFVVFGSVMSGLLVLITLARAFYYLVGRRDM